MHSSGFYFENMLNQLSASMTHHGTVLIESMSVSSVCHILTDSAWYRLSQAEVALKIVLQLRWYYVDRVVVCGQIEIMWCCSTTALGIHQPNQWTVVNAMQWSEHSFNAPCDGAIEKPLDSTNLQPSIDWSEFSHKMCNIQFLHKPNNVLPMPVA